MLTRKLPNSPGAKGIVLFIYCAALVAYASLTLAACQSKCGKGLVLKGKLCQRADSATVSGAGAVAAAAGNSADQSGSGGILTSGVNASGDGGMSTPGSGTGVSGSRGPGGANSAAESGAGGNGTAGSDAAPEAESCTTVGALRCSMSGAGSRDKCSNGAWVPDAPCAGGETCVLDPAGNASCVVVAELCRGSGGQTVCDSQGSLIVCNTDESIASMMACESAKHCMAGVAAQTCATCIPAEDHQCTGVSLEQCAADGMSFTKLMDCETEGLCNAMLGQCTDAVCAPGQKACDGNNLVTCNADGTAIEGMDACANGMCDADGGDCNECQPGTKDCDGDMAITCDATGQTWEPMACPSSAPKCVGLGQCVQCENDEDCGDLTEGCKVGKCNQNRCMAANAPNSTMCQASGGKPGMCASGSCMCTPQCGSRECGDNGCNGSCGSCGGEMCNGSGQCVECLDSGDCTDATECQTPSCTGGMCRYNDRSSGSCGRDGECRSGSCCESDCGIRDCGPPPNGCGSDCGECRTGNTCNSSTGMCELTTVGLGSTCTPGGDNQQGNCQAGLTCQTIIRGGFGCYRAIETVPGCDFDSTPQRGYMGVACLDLCDPALPGGICNRPFACEGGWCVMP